MTYLIIYVGCLNYDTYVKKSYYKQHLVSPVGSLALFTDIYVCHIYRLLHWPVHWPGGDAFCWGAVGPRANTSHQGQYEGPIQNKSCCNICIIWRMCCHDKQMNPKIIVCDWLNEFYKSGQIQNTGLLPSFGLRINENTQMYCIGQDYMYLVR